jgi:hypothetical protein
MNANPLRMLCLVVFFIAMAALLDTVAISKLRHYHQQPITESAR